MSQWKSIGRGTPAGANVTVRGEAVYVRDAADVMEALNLLKDRAGSAILVTHEAGGAGVGILLDHVAGVITTVGGPSCHLAILAREYGLPCLVSATLESDPTLNDVIELDGQGRISAPVGTSHKDLEDE